MTLVHQEEYNGLEIVIWHNQAYVDHGLPHLQFNCHLWKQDFYQNDLMTLRRDDQHFGNLNTAIACAKRAIDKGEYN